MWNFSSPKVEWPLQQNTVQNHTQQCLMSYRSVCHAGWSTYFFSQPQGWYLLPIQCFTQVCDKTDFGTRSEANSSAYKANRRITSVPPSSSPAFQTPCAILSCSRAQQPLQLSTLLTRITVSLVLPGPITTTAAEVRPLCNLSCNYGQQHLREGGGRTRDGNMHMESLLLRMTRLMWSREAVAYTEARLMQIACSQHHSPLWQLI